MNIPVITVDGPSLVGKGTLSRQLAHKLGFHYVDSGFIYRLVAHEADLYEMDPDDKFQKGPLRDLPKQLSGAVAIASNIDVEFKFDASGNMHIMHGGIELTEQTIQEIRGERMSQLASKWSAVPDIREALRDWFLRQQKEPGLVYDGRDGGTFLFPDARLKFFVVATAHTRALRRAEQLRKEGKIADVSRLEEEIRVRDERDSTRARDPLQRGTGAIIVDTDILSIEEAFNEALRLARERKLVRPENRE